MYKIYTAPEGVESISPMEKQNMLFKGVDTMDEAIGWASHMSRTGHSVLLIEGDDGTKLDKSEIADALRRYKI
ncbi:hypothetical protein A33M_2983 [Rhodovulum sp. PH10]|uniref:hypothetical protein n=1 Tax=Rhodovulum sp. PH10 TaxID=1187851 RepID=UPI00027C2CDD|nr:hypothetical protein [Rhodovulum sp. PH10]EJW11624.1 hypothetical protein A33M_2983 [Rhodovulum sp. PH10]